MTCLALVRDFLVFGSASGVITTVYLPELALVSEFRHDGGPITAVFPNQMGTRVAFLSDQDGFIYSPVDDTITPVPKMPPQVTPPASPRHPSPTPAPAAANNPH